MGKATAYSTLSTALLADEAHTRTGPQPQLCMGVVTQIKDLDNSANGRDSIPMELTPFQLTSPPTRILPLAVVGG